MRGLGLVWLSQPHMLPPRQHVCRFHCDDALLVSSAFFLKGAWCGASSDLCRAAVASLKILLYGSSDVFQDTAAAQRLGVVVCCKEWVELSPL
jgi:hypothetical protein